MTLDIAIITYKAEGIRRLAEKNLPVIDSVRYVISWQDHQNAPIPETLVRPDIEIHRFDGIGLSANRNNSINKCKADIVLVSDDDLTYIPEGLKAIIDTYRDNPDIDFASFICVHDSPRMLPQTATTLNIPLPRGYSICSCDISFRREAIINNGIRFHTLLGLNSPEMHSGEDDFFLLCAIKKGLKCKFFPIVTCIHPHESTGTKSKMTAENVRGSGCIIALTYPLSWLPRIFLKAWRLSRKGQFGFFKGVAVMLQGALKSPRIRKGYW